MGELELRTRGKCVCARLEFVSWREHQHEAVRRNVEDIHEQYRDERVLGPFS